MNLREAKQELREHGYRVYKHQLMLDEGATDMLKKIGKLIHKWKKEADVAKKEGDEEKQKEIQDNCEDLKDEIYDKGLLNKFRNNKGLAKGIFLAMGILMLSAGASQAHAAAVADAHLGSSGHAPIAMSSSGGNVFDMMDKVIDASCGDNPDSCHVNGDAVKDGSDGHTAKQDLTGGEADGEGTFSWSVGKKQVDSNGNLMLRIHFDKNGDGQKEGEGVIRINPSGDIEEGRVWLTTYEHGQNISGDFIDHAFPGIEKTANVLAHNLLNK